MMPETQRITQDTVPNHWFRRWLPMLTEVWVLGVIVAFLVIRVLGSTTAKQFLRSAGH